MDTVTNAELSIALALQGGIAAIHYNHKTPDGRPDIDAQVAEVEKVKRFQSGFIHDPVTISPGMTIAEACLRGEGFRVGDAVIDAFPVTEDGVSNGKLVGLLRKDDYIRGLHDGLRVAERMLPLSKLITGDVGITLEEAQQVIDEHRIPSLPIVGTNGNLAYLVTKSDIQKRFQFPLATKDEEGRLRVLFAVETRPEIAEERLKRCFAAGADGVIVDTSQGFNDYSGKMLDWIKRTYPDKLLIGGNVSTREAAMFLQEIGVDAYRCGQGSGSICTTAGSIGVSRSGATGVYECAKVLQGYSDIKTIADGGIRQVGDIVKALAVGAHCVMVGNLLAGTTESPGEVKIDPETGHQVKVYRGMGSAEAAAERGYGKLPQGVSGQVKHRGSVHEWVPLIRDGLVSALQTYNCSNVGKLHAYLRNQTLRFGKRSAGAIAEAGVHDLKR